MGTRTYASLGIASVASLAMVVSVAGCPSPNIVGGPLKTPETNEAFPGVQCAAVRPRTEPDLMGWDSGSRADLNRLRNEGVVAVRYEAKGCTVELELLSNCIGPGGATAYRYRPYVANDKKIAHNAN